MTVVSRAAVPWTLIVALCGLVAVLMALVAAWPAQAWPLQGAAVGLLAGGAALALDEPSAAIVDTLPRGLAWRTVAHAAAVLPLLFTWAACIGFTADRLPPRGPVFLLQGGAAVVLAVALATAGRAAGAAEPGTTVARVAIPLCAMLAVARPLPEAVPLFPIWPAEPWARTIGIWLGAGALGLLILADSLSHRLRPRQP